MTSKIVVNNIEADAGINTVTISGDVTATNVTGTHHGSAANLTSIPAGNLTGTVADARISTLTASKLSGALPAISAANLTNIPAANITGTLPAISGANLTGISAGKILQVQSTTRTDTFSESLGIGALSADALTVNITPSNASNKIFLIAHVSMGLNNDNEVNWVFYKAGSLLTGAAGTAASNRKPRTTAGDVRWTGTHHTFGGQYLDTAGGTSQITYAVKLGHSANGTKTVYLNRSHTDDNYAYDIRTQSTLTAMEVEA
jgi:hypothetical protein